MVSGRRNPLYFGLARRLKQTRRLSGMKRLPLAEKAGLAAATERDIETGKSLPTVGTIARLASALGVPAPWLAYGIGDQTSDEQEAICDTMGARLKAVRIEQTISKAELGRLAGLTAPSITQIENGGQSGVEVVEALAQALGVSPGWLAYGLGPQVLPAPRRGRPPTLPAEPEPSR